MKLVSALVAASIALSGLVPDVAIGQPMGPPPPPGARPGMHQPGWGHPGWRRHRRWRGRRCHWVWRHHRRVWVCW